MPWKQPTIVLAEPDNSIRDTLAEILQYQVGIRVLKSATMREAAELIIKHDPDLVLTEDLLEDGGNGNRINSELLCP